MNNLDTKLIASKYDLIYESKYVKVASYVVGKDKEVEGLLNSAYVSFDLFYKNVSNLAKKVYDLERKNFNSGIKYIYNLREKIKSYCLEIDKIELYYLFENTYDSAMFLLRMPKNQLRLAKTVQLAARIDYNRWSGAVSPGQIVVDGDTVRLVQNENGQVYLVSLR